MLFSLFISNTLLKSNMILMIKPKNEYTQTLFKF